MTSDNRVSIAYMQCSVGTCALLFVVVYKVVVARCACSKAVALDEGVC